MWRAILNFLTGGALDRVLDTVDKRIETGQNRDKIKGDILIASIRSRGDWMRAGGFVLMLLFAVPLAAYFAYVLAYSALWCSRCIYPQDFIVAALPPPFDEWSAAIIVSIFGVVGVGLVTGKGK